MPQQASLFKERRTGRIDQSTGQQIREVVGPAQGPDVVPVARIGSDETVDIPRTLLEDMLDALTGVRGDYYDILRSVTLQGYTTQDGATIHTLTDREAAAWVASLRGGCERTTICGRRNELMGGSGGDAFEHHPAVEAAGRRHCHVRPSGPEVTCYRVRLDLYSADLNSSS